MLFNSFKSMDYKIGIKVALTSPSVVISWAVRQVEDIIFLGCVSEPYTIDYSTGIPVDNGLFCEKIFGPVLSWNCRCDLFNSLDPITISCYCPLCGGENTNSRIRRYRMGYISLMSPVFHTWYINNKFISTVLECPLEDIENLIYYSFLRKKIDTSTNVQSFSQYIFASEYIRYKLANTNFVDLIIKLREISIHSKKSLNKGLYPQNINLLNLFIINNINPTWVLIDALPVIPAGLRPLIRGGDDDQNDLIVSNINEFYRTILILNNRIKRMREIEDNTIAYLELVEKANLQETVDLLLNSSICNEEDSSNSSLSKLKKDFFKNYILGKRVDFSGRSVIVSGPTLPYLHLGLPLKLGINLFKHKLLKLLYNNTILKELLYITYYCGCSKLVLKRLLKYIYSKEILLINRAPTLHRMNVQLFKPYFVEGDALKLYPLACSGFNADFDGDQMGLFLLISSSVNKEAQKIMIHDKNIMHPSIIKNLFKYNQSIVLGLNTLLSIKYNRNNNQLIYNTIEDAFNSYSHNLIDGNTIFLIKLNTSNLISNRVIKKYIITSIGRLLLCNIV